MARSCAIAALGLALAALASGCASDQDAGFEGTTLSRTEGLAEFAQPGAIDEAAGAYRGVGIGDPVAAVEEVFGDQRPASLTEPGTPLRYTEGGDDGPWVIAFGDGDPFGPALRYHDVVFVFAGAELGAFVVVEPGAATARGVEVGDELAAVESAYPELACGTAGEGSEYAEYPACTGKLAPSRYVWFGGDPIKSVALSTHPLGGF